MVVRISGRAEALNNANAPLDDLFDFVPRADSKWICKPNQWNNTRKGSCSFTKHEAVSPTVLNAYQGAVPLLGNYIPSWATVDPLKQGVSSQWTWIGAEHEYLHFQLSCIPYGKIRLGTRFMQTMFRSDVHTVECHFVNGIDGRIMDQASANSGICRRRYIKKLPLARVH